MSTATIYGVVADQRAEQIRRERQTYFEREAASAGITVEYFDGQSVIHGLNAGELAHLGACGWQVIGDIAGKYCAESTAILTSALFASARS